MNLTAADITQLQKVATKLRISVLEMLIAAKSGHAAGPLGIADVMAYLYFKFLRHDPKQPDWLDRDYFLISNGHVCPIWYAALAHSGYFPIDDLKTLRKLDSHLQGHPKNTSTPGVFNSSGPLGHGVGQAIGVAIGLKQDKKMNQVYCLMSDGEQQEGAIWESMLVAAKYKLGNLTFILDLNGIQIDGDTKDIMPLPNMSDIYSSVGWEVINIDGHNYSEINAAFVRSRSQERSQPLLVIAHTVPGKGAPKLEGKYQYHDWRGEDDVASESIKVLEQIL